MTTRDSHLEVKVGIFVVSAMIAMTYFVMSVTDMSWFSKRHNISIIFTFANGLRDTAPVRLAGVEAGLVKAMKVYTDHDDNKKTKVLVSISVNEGINIPVDSKATINQLGLLGEKYIEIIPGVAQEFYKSGDTIIGKDPVPIEKIAEQISSVTTKIETTILPDLADIIRNTKEGKGTVGKFLTDEAIYNNLQELTADLKANPWKLLYRPKSK